MHKHLTPAGVRDFVPAEAEDYRSALRKITKVFESFQYQRVRTPTIEYFDTLAIGLGDALKASAIRFFDGTGQTLMLRPDHTTPLARLVATRMRQETLPLRLYYLDPVFRQPQAGKEQEIEVFQAGLELIGEASPAAEAETMMICIETLLKLGLTEFGLEIGHTDFASQLSDTERTALLNNDYLTLGKIPARGGIEIIADHPNLVRLYEILQENQMAQYVRFNKGLVKDLAYYTGFIFECYSSNTRRILGSGGRYDDLFAKFGIQYPAVGFALDVGLLQKE